MSLLKIEARDNKTSFLPGEAIKGKVFWQLDELPERIDLRLLWRSTGKNQTEEKS